MDLSSLKLYRNMFAVDRVGPYEHHFTVWFHNIEPNFVQLRARLDQATGRVHIEVDRGMWGGIGAPPKTPSSPPPNVAELARALEREARSRCPDSSSWVFQYTGAYREIDLVEFMPVRPEGGVTRVGWHGTITLAADEGLSRLVSPPPDYKSGDGMIEASEPLQWVRYAPPPELTGTALMIDRLMRLKGSAPPASAEGTLIEHTLDAARRLQAKEPSPALAEIVSAQGPSLFPPSMDQRLRVRVSLYARPKKGALVEQQGAELSIPIKTNEAVLGPVRGEAEKTVGGVQVKVRAVLVPRAPSTTGTASGTRRFEATLQLHVEDADGHMFERSYPVQGDVLVEGATAVTLVGLGLPGASGPSKEMDALHGQLPGKGNFEVIDFYVASGITDDPREN